MDLIPHVYNNYIQNQRCTDPISTTCIKHPLIHTTPHNSTSHTAQHSPISSFRTRHSTHNISRSIHLFNSHRFPTHHKKTTRLASSHSHNPSFTNPFPIKENKNPKYRPVTLSAQNKTRRRAIPSVNSKIKKT